MDTPTYLIKKFCTRPLHEAAENGYVEIVRLLLSYGADPNLATYSGSTPLSLAVEESTLNLLRNHINDIQGLPSDPWRFLGPASCFGKFRQTSLIFFCDD